MKYCPNCGAAITPEAKKCAECGLDLTRLQDPRTSQINAPTKVGSRWSLYRWLLIVAVALVVGWVGYLRLYVPQVTKEAIQATHFTTKQGYQTMVNPKQRQIVISLGSQASQQVQQELIKTGYSTKKIAVEKQLAKLSQRVNQRTVGDWQIMIVNQTGVLWKYKGARMVYRFQTSNLGKQVRQQYLLRNSGQSRQVSTPETMIPVVNVMSQLP